MTSATFRERYAALLEEARAEKGRHLEQVRLLLAEADLHLDELRAMGIKVRIVMPFGASERFEKLGITTNLDLTL